MTNIMAWAPSYSPSSLSFPSSSGFSRITPQLYEICLSPQPQHYKRTKKANPPLAHLRETPALLLFLCGCCQPFHTPHFVLFSPWGLQPSRGSLRCFSGHGQPPQRRSARPRIPYWQQHSTLQKIIHLTGLNFLCCHVHSKTRNYTNYFVGGFFFCKGFIFFAAHQHCLSILHNVFFITKMSVSGRKKENFLRRLMCTIFCN